MSSRGKPFEKGHAPWNKGCTGLTSANKTSFTVERMDAIAKVSIGVPRLNGKNGLVCLTEERFERKDPRHPDRHYLFRKRVPHARFVMERHIGRKLRRDECVWHRDGDRMNNDISNLEIVSRAEMCRRNTMNRA